MTCQFKRCQDETVHCNGACHGLMPDGSPMTETEMPELADPIPPKPETVNKTQEGPSTGA